MRGEHLIEFKRQGRAEFETWGYRIGTLPEAKASALRLRAELRESYPRAQVRVNGKQLRERGET